MADSQTPLLTCAEEERAGSDAAAVAARLEAGLSETDVIDFEDLLRNNPDHVIEFIAEHGTRKLGSFITEDTEVLPLIRDGSIWTLGSSRLDIDYERVWKHYLEHDTYKAKGFATKVEVEAHVVTIRNAALPDDRGILNPLLEKWQDGALSTKVFGLPAVQAVIQFKWDMWAYKVLVWEFLAYLVWLIGFQIFILLFQDEDLDRSIGYLAHTGRGLVTIVSLIVSGLAMLPFLYIEACTITEYGPMRWLNVWNALDIAAYVLQIGITVMYFARWHLASETLSIMMAAQILVLVWRIQYFARAFQPLKNSFVDTLRAVIVDVRWFLLLLVVTLWGFAGTFYILFRNEQGDNFKNMWHALLTLFSFMLGGFELDPFYKSRIPIVGIALLMFFIFSMSLVLLNCLIAIMSDAATKAADDDGTKYLCSKAQLIDELESSLPQWMRSPKWYPQFIHILKVNPESAQRVEGGRLWALSTNTSGVSPEEPDEVKTELAAVKEQVTRLEDLLKEALARK